MEMTTPEWLRFLLFWEAWRCLSTELRVILPAGIKVFVPPSLSARLFCYPTIFCHAFRFPFLFASLKNRDMTMASMPLFFFKKKGYIRASCAAPQVLFSFGHVLFPVVWWRHISCEWRKKIIRTSIPCICARIIVCSSSFSVVQHRIG